MRFCRQCYPGDGTRGGDNKRIAIMKKNLSIALTLAVFAAATAAPAFAKAVHHHAKVSHQTEHSVRQAAPEAEYPNVDTNTGSFGE
jgi:hypothetical protein